MNSLQVIVKGRVPDARRVSVSVVYFLEDMCDSLEADE
jgi:hypothetical protein